jgi:hypothetical protein
MSCTATLVTRFVQHRVAWPCWARRLFTLSCLDRGFLIQAEEPRSLPQEGVCLSIGLQHGTCSLQEGVRIMDVLPGMIAPGTEAVGFEPPTHRAG